MDLLNLFSKKKVQEESSKLQSVLKLLAIVEEADKSTANTQYTHLSGFLS